jgi:hypothetical protein
MTKKSILDNIYYNLGRQHTDFRIFGLSKDFSTQHKTYQEVCFPLDFNQTTPFLEKVNNRTICQNEIVLDIEDKTNFEQLKEKLSSPLINDCDILMYDTGSRGLHIHLWYNNPISTKIKENLIKIFGADALKSGEYSPIALENVPHWKTGKKKELIWERKNL